MEAFCVLCIQASTLTKADATQEVLVTSAQVKGAGHGAIKALFGWAVIILPRSQDLECHVISQEFSNARLKSYF